MSLLELPITWSMRKRASSKAATKNPYRNSITKGKGDYTGFLAEIAIAEYIGAGIVDTSDYDLYYPEADLEIEVKTKRRNVFPEDHFESTVGELSEHQRPDHYIFVSAYKEKRFFVIGDCSYEYFQKHTHEGEAKQNSSSFRFEPHTKMNNIYHSKLSLSSIWSMCYPLTARCLKCKGKGGWIRDGSVTQCSFCIQLDSREDRQVTVDRDDTLKQRDKQLGFEL